jgi:phosphoglycolate phosphatase-like HAD superfamily hydrolase
VLLLFDIDGTLLRGATDAHRDAVQAALRSVYDLHHPADPHIDPAGRTDLEIARAILLRAGLAARHIDTGLPEFRAACAEQYARLCPPDLSQYVIPGVPELLAELAARPEVTLSLVTGNLEPIARLKLRRAGLGQYFAPGQGAFGSDAEDRTLLPGIARRRAGQDGAPYPRPRTLVIGDTPRDIACARADRVRCFAVATGPVAADRLAEADVVARDTAELGQVLRAELDSPTPAPASYK